MPSLLCIGLGYCAQHYVAEFGARFDRIVGTTRTAESAAAMRARSFGGRQTEVLSFNGEQVTPELIATVRDADALLISAAPDERGDPVLAALGDALAHASKLRSIVYLSTIGVYGDRGGEWVDETSEARPISSRSRQRLAAEQAWQALGAQRGIPVAILRLAGIYGPGRNALINVARGNTRRIDKPGQVFNRIHVADIAQAIEAAFAHSADGIFNLADDEPGPPGEPLAFAANLLGITPPPEIPYAEAAKTMSPMALSFYGESKRVRNACLKNVLGVRLRYPTYREGLRALYEADDHRAGAN